MQPAAECCRLAYHRNNVRCANATRLWHPSQRSCSVLVDVDTCALHRYAWLGTSPLLSALAASDVYPLASPFEAGHGGTALALHRDSRWILGAHSGKVGSHTLAFPNAC